MHARMGTLVGALVLSSVSSLAAQAVPWDSPLLLPPREQPNVGIYLADLPRSDIAALAMLRSGRGPYMLGLRGGLADTDNGLSIFGGFDLSSSIARMTREFPLDLSWVFAAGVSYGEIQLPFNEEDGYFFLSIPLGITLGRSFDAEGLRFQPYATPRLMLDALFGLENADSEVELDFAVDIGLDFGFQPGWALRFGATLGDRDAIAIGIVF